MSQTSLAAKLPVVARAVETQLLVSLINPNQCTKMFLLKIPSHDFKETFRHAWIRELTFTIFIGSSHFM
jgi:hypothetical protein